MQREHRFIAIEGLPAIGKTELALKLKDSIGGRLILDEPDQNPFLLDSLEQAEQSAFQCQLFYLMNRFKQHELMNQLDIFDSRIISDSFFGRNHIYATMTLSEKEFLLYKKIEAVLEQEAMLPDLIIYLQCNLDKLWIQFESRFKSLKGFIDKDYLKRLDRYYQEYFFNYEDAPVLIINTSFIDFMGDDNDYTMILNEILKHKSGQKYLIAKT